MRVFPWQTTIAALLVALGPAIAQDRPRPNPGFGLQPHAPQGQRPRQPGFQPRPQQEQMQPGKPGKPGSDARQMMFRQIFEQLRQKNPKRLQELMELRKTNRDAFGKEMRVLVQTWQKRNQKRRGGASEEELLCRELSWRYHDTEDEAEKEKLRKDLEVAVGKVFEVRTKAMETRIEHMEKELEKFRERLKVLKENRQRVCEDRVEELLRPPELNWDAAW